MATRTTASRKRTKRTAKAAHKRAARPKAKPATDDVGMALWVRLMVMTVSVYLAVHVGAFLLAALQIIRVDAIFFGISTKLWIQAIEIVSIVMVAAIGASQGAGRVPQRRKSERAPVKIDPWLSSIARRTEEIDTTGRSALEVISDLSLLYEVGQGISATIELQQLLERVTDLLQKNLKLREFAILLLDEERQFLQVKAAYGFRDEARIQDMVFQVGEGVSGEVARTGAYEYLKSTARDSRYLNYRGELQANGSLLSMPLTYKGDVLGVVNFGRGKTDAFSKGDIHLLGLLTNQIALAVANARLYSKTRELAVRDDLTGLYNRRHFLDVLQVEWKRALRFRRGVAVLMIDVDHFKSFNDNFGHLHGDRVLRKLADILRRNLREVDTLARFGGEEFIALLPDTDKAGAMHVGEKLRRIVESERFPVPEGSESQPLTISIGVSVHPDDASQLDDLIDHADISLYDAKDSGRNRAVCYPTKDRDIANETTIVASEEEIDIRILKPTRGKSGPH